MLKETCGLLLAPSCRKSSVIIAADESTISWGPSPAFGELVSLLITLMDARLQWLVDVLMTTMTSPRIESGNVVVFCRQGYGDNKPKSSTTAQEVRTLDGIYIEKVGPRSTEDLRGNQWSSVDLCGPWWTPVEGTSVDLMRSWRTSVDLRGRSKARSLHSRVTTWCLQVAQQSTWVLLLLSV